MRPSRVARARRWSRLTGGTAGAGGGGGGVQGLAASIAALAPVSSIKFNEASGSLTDYGSRGGSATATGTPLYRNEVGPDGDSYVRLTGANYFDLADGADLSINAATGKTFCIGFLPRSLAANDIALLGKASVSASVREYGLFVDSPGTAKVNIFAWQGATSSTYINQRTPAVTIDQWHFLIVRFNTSGPASMFLDSTTANGADNTGPTGSPPTDKALPLSLGAVPSFAIFNKGALAHFGMWNRALSDPECVTLMTAAKTQGWAP